MPPTVPFATSSRFAASCVGSKLLRFETDHLLLGILTCRQRFLKPLLFSGVQLAQEREVLRQFERCFYPFDQRKNVLPIVKATKWKMRRVAHGFAVEPAFLARTEYFLQSADPIAANLGRQIVL
jgi:hypothetical protein